LLNLDYDPWHSVNATLGVSRMIAFGDHPSPTPTGFVEALVDRSNESGLLYVPENLNICQSVKILTGPFAELAGTLAHFDDNGRVCVLLDIMGSRIPVALKQASIAA
jgi:transcriptional antiterminator RfaH